jgi:nucleoside-diphosphate-sugar epimerase
MNVFLTGGTGFIGSYVAVALAGQGHRVTILARNRNKVPELKKISIELHQTHRMGSPARRYIPDGIHLGYGRESRGEAFYLHVLYRG